MARLFQRDTNIRSYLLSSFVSMRQQATTGRLLTVLLDLFLFSLFDVAISMWLSYLKYPLGFGVERTVLSTLLYMFV